MAVYLPVDEPHVYHEYDDPSTHAAGVRVDRSMVRTISISEHVLSAATGATEGRATNRDLS